MAIDIGYYRKISGSYGCDTKQDQMKASIGNDFKNQFNDKTLGYETVLINNVSKGVIIQNKSSKNSLYVTKQVTMLPNDEINMGDLIEWNNTYWLCTQADDVHGIYQNGLIRECNNTLKFYNNYTLYEIPCVFDTSLLVEDEKQFMTLSDDTFSLFCRNDSDSSLIDHNTRFLISGNAYKVEGIDNLRYVGILEIKIRKDQIQTANDNVDLGIADWGINQITKTIVIKNSDTAKLLYQNATLQLEVECRNNNVIVNNPTVTYSSNATNVATVNSSGKITAIGTGTATITAIYGTATDTITITSVEVVTNDYNITLSPQDSTIKFGKSKVFTASILNNGIVASGQSCLWTLVNSDGSSLPYANISIDNLTCTVTATSNSNYIGKYIKLRATFVEDANVYAEREIKIVGLL